MKKLDTEQRLALEEIIEQAALLAHDYGEDVAEVVRLAAEQPLDRPRAERLWTRIITILRTASPHLTVDERRLLAEQVENEVQAVVRSVDRPGSDHRPPIQLRAKYGVEPHDVSPVPMYNGLAVPMTDGYVDVTEINLWRGNHRLELQVAEFIERYNREPDDQEVLAMMQGTLPLPSLTDRDPFQIVPLAESIARKGVERPPILTFDGQPKDGNRRLAAAKYVVSHPDRFSIEQIERARWVRVWLARELTPDEMFEAIVVSYNFEPELKLPWPEYVKARLVSERWDVLREVYRGRLTEAITKKMRKDVADHFAITPQQVTRYLRMVEWAQDFESYHVNERGIEPAEVRYRTDDIFQWFYEIDAGKGTAKLEHRMETDPDVREVVYDLMFNVLDSGALVRNMHKMLSDDDTEAMVMRAYEHAQTGTREGRKDALELLREADAEVRRRSAARRKINFDEWLRNAVTKLGSTSPDDWKTIPDTELLSELRRVFHGAIGAIEGVLESREIDEKPEAVAETGDRHHS